MEEQELDTSIFDEIDSLIKSTDLSNVSASSTGFDDLPFGYYKTMFSGVKFGKTKATQAPMISITFQVLEDGYKLDESNTSNINFERIGGVTKRLIFKNYVLTDSKGLKNLVSDLKKVEDPMSGEPLLTDEDLADSKHLQAFMNLFVESNVTMWVRIRETTKKDGTKGSWTDLIPNSTAQSLGLI